MSSSLTSPSDQQLPADRLSFMCPSDNPDDADLVAAAAAPKDGQPAASESGQFALPVIT